MKYNVGDVVKFNKNKGSYEGIMNYGTIVEVGQKGYYIDCPWQFEDGIADSLYFFESEISGLFENNS